MNPTTSAEHSLWLAEPPTKHYPKLAGRADADVAVIGAGVAGLSIALLLARQGASVAVVEAADVGSGVTACTTAKVSALQATMYSTIRRRHGIDAARNYAAASRAGVEKLGELVDEEGIECALERRPAATYAAEPGQRRAVEREAQLAQEAGLPVEFVETIDVPFPVHGAVLLADQLQLHPVQYSRGLADAAQRHGARIFEQSRVLDVRGARPAELRTAEGVLRADRVVVATHYPILDRGGYFARMTLQRSYCIAARLASGAAPQVMSISAGSPTRSVRDFGDQLIVGGEGHPTGDSAATPDRFSRLAAFASEYWDVADITGRWSAQDPVHYDKLPVIGPYYPGSDRLWVASGFMKWGFATATFAAMIIADQLAGRDNPWAAAFTPSRISLASLPGVAEVGAKYVVDLVGDRLRPARRGTDDLPRGAARVVADGLGRTGVYRDDDGRQHAVSLRCTHLGCLLRFNSAERSWDCPCHGSRFGVDGEVLEGPAVRPLDRREVADRPDFAADDERGTQ